jgi:hypothetical protein
MSVEVRIIKNLFGGLAQRLDDGAARVVEANAEAVAEHARQNIMTGPKTGHVYGTHQASAPGESPANENGDLVGSISARPIGRKVWEVAVDAEYAATLELGSPGGKIAPRPFLAPAAEAVRDALLEQMAELLRL